MSRPTIKILSLGTELKLLRLSLGLSRSELAKKVAPLFSDFLRTKVKEVER